jgi:hypothetical protein
MSHSLLKLSAAAALFIASPALASAQSVAYSNSPVSVTSCSVAADNTTPSRIDFPIAFGGPASFYGSNQQAYALSYVNKGAVPATAVVLALSDGNGTQNVISKGTFAPGVQIARNFTATAQGAARENASCSVAEVDFADGTSWKAPHEVANR